MDQHEPRGFATEEAARLALEDRLIQEALDDVAAGNTVSLQSVFEWMDSWDTDHELPAPGTLRT